MRRGGKGAPNRYRPILFDPQNVAGDGDVMTRKFLSDDTQYPAPMPRKELRTNPIEEPVDEPRQPRRAPAEGDQYNRYGDARFERASVDPVCPYSLEDHVEIEGHGLCRIVSIDTDDRGRIFLTVYMADDQWNGLVVPLDSDGRVMQDRVRWEDE